MLNCNDGEVSNTDDDLLVREIGRVAGSFGSFGARLVAKRLTTKTCTEKLALQITPQRASTLGRTVLSNLGKLQAGINETLSSSLKAVIGSGHMNLNPAVVSLTILAVESAWCEIIVTAKAKEGLIDQQTAEKAAERVASALKEMAKEPSVLAE